MNPSASTAVILLMKGLFYKEENEKAWYELVGESFGTISDYFETIGAAVHVDEAEGYAYLRQRTFEEDEAALPKVIATRELGYKTSLLCVLLRKKITDFEMKSDDGRAVVSREELIEQITLFLPMRSNEVKLRRDIEQTIGKVEALGFLKKLKKGGDVYEIRRAIKAFVDAQWLGEFDRRLQEYKEADAWS